MMNRHYVYIIFRSNGHPCYVGKGCRGRWKHHYKYATNPWLKAIIEIEGELPCVKIASGLSDAEACKVERIFIAAIGRAKNGGPLINMTDGGDGMSGWTHTIESISKIRAAWLRLGPEERAARLAGIRAADGQRSISEAQKEILRNKIITEETRAKMRESSAIRWARDAEERAERKATRKEAAKTGRKPGGQKGYKHTEQARANMAAAQQKRAWSPPPSMRAAVAEANRRRVLTPEAREKLRMRKSAPMTDYTKRALWEGRILGRMARGEL